MCIEGREMFIHLLPKVVKNLFRNKYICRYTCIQNQIIHKQVHVDYNPLKGMLVFISSLKWSTVPYAGGSESRGHSRTAWLYIDVKLLPNVRWILNFVDQPTHENWYLTNKSDFTVQSRVPLSVFFVNIGKNRRVPNTSDESRTRLDEL